MPQKAPGKSHREGITLIQLTRMFPDDQTAERWFIEQRWPDGVHCPACGIDQHPGAAYAQAAGLSLPGLP